MDKQTNIVLKAKSGERAAFEQLYVGTKDKIYFLCLKFLKNEADALDIVSDTYLTAIEKLDTLKQPEYFETWLNKIAVNKCKNYLAKNKAVLFSEQEDMERCAEELPELNKEFIPESYVADKEKREQIMAVIDSQLSDVQRSVILMYYYSEIGVREIAEELDCSEGTVKSRLCSARNIIYKYVTDMQKKGEVLFSMGSIPLLSLLLQEVAKEYTVSEAQSAIILQQCIVKYDKVFLSDGKAAVEQIGNGTNNGIEQAGNISGKVVEQGAIGMAKKTIITKVAVAIVGVAVVGATIAGISISKKNHNNQNEAPVDQSHEVVTEADTDGTETIAVQEASTEDEASGKKDVYILPESNTRYIKPDEITDFDTEKLNLAKNEIYARHGLVFSTDSIKKYFENCAWYEPSVASSEFSDSVFNEYEVANIALLEDYEKLSGYTYPLEVKNGESVKVDLNGDGELEKVSLNVKSEKRIEKWDEETEIERYENKITITVGNTVIKYVNDSTYNLYVVDIDTSDNKREICFEMWEPNDFTGSIFWQYSTANELKRLYFEDEIVNPGDDLELENEEYATPITDWTYGINYLGDGRITCLDKCYGITQYFVYHEFRLTEKGYFEYVDRIYEFPNDMEKFFNDKDEIILTLKKDIKLYKEPSKSSKTFTVKPQKLKIVASCAGSTENSVYCWSKLELEDGSTGWILPSDKTTEAELNEIFDGVHFSG